MAKKPTVPIKVTAHLLDGRISSADGIIMLDAILYHAWFCKYKPEVLEGCGSVQYDGYTGLPLRQLPGNRWAASKGIFESDAKSIEYTNKRPNFFNADKIDKLDMDSGIISDSVGIYPCVLAASLISPYAAPTGFHALRRKDQGLPVDG